MPSPRPPHQEPEPEPGTVRLAHGAIVLRDSTPADAPMVRELSRDPYVPQIGTIPPDASQSQALAWIQSQWTKRTEGKGLPFTIAEAATDEAMGHCGLWLGGLAAGRATIGYAIASGRRGRGFAADALIALTTFAWIVPGLHRIEVYVEPSNGASARTAQKAGYEREGLLRSHQEIGGERRDMVLYAAIRPASA